MAAINGCRMKRNLIGASARSMSWCQMRLKVSIETPYHTTPATISTRMRRKDQFRQEAQFLWLGIGHRLCSPLPPVRLAQRSGSRRGLIPVSIGCAWRAAGR